MQLLESGEHDGYNTVDVIHGLYGVCFTLDRIQGPPREYAECDAMGSLHSTAFVLASILRCRMTNR
jgi:hypothetical protein